MPAAKGNKYALKKFDWSRVDDLLKIGCTGEEIALVIGLDYDTINNRCKKLHKIKFSEYVKKGFSGFKISLRRVQWRSAMGAKDENGKMIIRPSVAMQIFLGKQYLGQSDKVEAVDERDTQITTLEYLW